MDYTINIEFTTDEPSYAAAALDLIERMLPFIVDNVTATMTHLDPEWMTEVCDCNGCTFAREMENGNYDR